MFDKNQVIGRLEPLNNLPSNFRDSLLNCLRIEPNSSSRLRLKHLGTCLDTEKLNENKFKKFDKNDDGWTTWEHGVDGNKRILISVSASGLLARLRLSFFTDLRDEGIGAPYGWYIIDDINPKSEKNISKKLNSITKTFPGKDNKIEWDQCLELLNFDHSEWEKKPENDFAIACYANDMYSNGKIEIASWLTNTLCRHLNDINNEFVLNDLPRLCGRLGMNFECVTVIKRILELDLDLTPEGWTNTGNVLCDNLHLPDAALLCFGRALKTKPNLWQAQKNIWVAGKRICEEAIKNKDLDKIMRVNAQIESFTDPMYSNHGFYCYLGLAYEGSKLFEKARESYEKAVNIDQNCVVSNRGIKRLSEKTYDEGDYKAQLNRLALWDLQYTNLTPET